MGRLHKLKTHKNPVPITIEFSFLTKMVVSRSHCPYFARLDVMMPGTSVTDHLMHDVYQSIIMSITN